MNFKEKLEKEKNDVTEKKSRAISNAVMNALVTFCEQEQEFAQAIEQTDRTFKECLNYVVDGCEGCISDLEAYEKAVQFYFPTAKINFHMTIDLCGDTGYNPPQIIKSENKILSVSLDSLLDF